MRKSFSGEKKSFISSMFTGKKDRRHAKSFVMDEKFEVLDLSETPEKDAEFIVKKMRQLIQKSELISIDHKGKLIQMLHDQEMRQTLTEVLLEVNAPKKIEDQACMKVISDIIKYVLTLFVHEQVTDYRLLAAILESSSNLYQKLERRKQSLSMFLMEHGIW